jgi:hypothetical protein
MSRRWLGATLLLIIGLLGLFQGLTSELSFDELIQYDTILGQGFLGMLSYILTSDHQLPLIYILLHPVVHLSAQSGFALFFYRSFSILFCLGTLVLYYRLLKFFIREKALRFLGVAILGSSHFFITNSVSARPYSAVLFFSCSLLYCLLTLKENSESYKWRLWSLTSFLLLSSSHYFGLLYGLFFVLAFFCWDRGKNRKWSLAFLFTLCILALIGLYQVDTLFLPQKRFPDFAKLIGGGVLFLGGPLNAVLILLFGLKQKVFKKKEWVKITIVFLSPLVLSILLSWLWLPLFEYRFFVPLIIFSTSLFIYLIQETTESFKEKESTRRFQGAIVVLLMLQALVHLQANSLAQRAPESHKAVEFLKDSALVSHGVLSCGNCPSFYLEKDRLACMGGWDFSKKPSGSKSEVSSIMIYTFNENFCLPLIKDGFFKKKSFKGIDIYLRSSVSR